MPDIVTAMPVTILTPQQAAAHAKVSRGTIMNALKEGNLQGFRNNRNRWQIKQDDLTEWLSKRGDNASVKAASSDTLNSSFDDGKTLRIAVLEAELKNKEHRISDLERDRDDWKAQAQELARRDIPTVQPRLPLGRRNWWPWKK